MNRIDRLVALLTTLQSNRYVQADDIADKYGISIRTVYRDLSALGEIGIPITFEKDRGYSVMSGYFLPPVSFTSEEANALILISSLSEKFGDTSIKERVVSAMEKLKTVLKESDLEKVELLENQTRVHHKTPPSRQELSLIDLQNAIADQRIIHIDYKNNQNKLTQRELEPIGLTFYSDQWHLIAWCWLREDYRDFKIQSIERGNVSDRMFRKVDHLDLNAYIAKLESRN